MVGHISELQRYWLAADNVLENLDQKPLSDGERETILHNAFRSTRLESLIREYEKNRSAMGLRDEHTEIPQMIDHVQHVLRTEETDAVTARPPDSTVMVVNRAKKGPNNSGKSQNSNGGRSQRFKQWFREHQGTCLKCERKGHLRVESSRRIFPCAAHDGPLRCMANCGGTPQHPRE